MYKLVILIPPPFDSGAFYEQWPHFLHAAERMPGLRRESSVHPHAHLFGPYLLEMIHELYFDGLSALEAALLSPEGQVAGEILQRITNRRATLLIAEHREDSLERIRSLRGSSPQE